MKNTTLTLKLVLLLGMTVWTACASKNPPEKSILKPVVGVEKLTPVQQKEFDQYWYNNKAEISTYTLSQARYGEMHKGNEVLVFVTEDYNMDKQVKKELPSSNRSAPIMKLNRIKRFTTGIYDYSMMTSVFKAMDTEKYPKAFKINNSSQDWCGQTWTVLHWDEELGYKEHLNSYFEAEVHDDRIIGKCNTEDEIMTQIRLNPRELPQGKFELIPSLNYARFTHNRLEPEEVTGRLMLELKDGGEEGYIYTLEYKSGRSLKIYCQSVFPYRIQGWEERRKSGFGDNAKWLTTIASLRSSINTDYWNKHSLKDTDLRKLLGL